MCYKPVIIKTVIIGLILSTIMLSSCKKTVAGPQGEQGPPGKDGSVTIKNRSSFSHPATAWTQDQNAWKSIVQVPEITRSVVDNGAVKVYVQVGSSWWELPYNSNGITTSAGIDLGIVILKNADNSGAATPQPITQNFRMVIIPPAE
jgi:hypothetical protein